MEEEGEKKRKYKILGSGAYGIVREGKLQGHICAIKKFNSNSLINVWTHVSLRETTSLICIPPHPNIVQLMCAYNDKKNRVHLIFPKRKCNLYEHLINLNKIISEDRLIKWTRQLVHAIGHVHKHNFVHRDIKLENILVTENEDLELADFGQAKFIPFESFPVDLTGIVCSPMTRAPELINKHISYYDDKIDSWSLGVVLLTLVYGKYIFKATDLNSINDLLKKIKSEEEFQAFCKRKSPTILYNIITQLLQVDPEKRVRVCDLWEILNINDTVIKETIKITPFCEECIVPDENNFNKILDDEHCRTLIGTYLYENLFRILKINEQTLLQSFLCFLRFCKEYSQALTAVEMFYASLGSVSLISKIQEFSLTPTNTFARIGRVKSNVIVYWENKIMKFLKGKLISVNISFKTKKEAIIFYCFLTYTNKQIVEINIDSCEEQKKSKIYLDYEKKYLK